MGLIQTLASLVKPLFNGLLQVLIGGFGPVVALVTWAEVVSIVLLALSHAATVPGAMALAVLMLLSAAVGALWSFLIVNGSAYSSNPQSTGRLAIVSALSSACLVMFITSAGFTVAALFFGVHGMLALTFAGALMAAVNSLGIVLALRGLIGRK